MAALTAAATRLLRGGLRLEPASPELWAALGISADEVRRGAAAGRPAARGSARNDDSVGGGGAVL